MLFCSLEFLFIFAALLVYWFMPCQLQRRKRSSCTRLHLVAQFFFLGLIKKLAVADRMALTFLSVCADWVFFRVPTFMTAAVPWRMAAFHAATAGAPRPGLGVVATIAVVIVCHLVRRFDLALLLARGLTADTARPAP